MKINIGTQYNIATQMLKTQSMISRSLERLSSGKRVNKAQDDVVASAEITNLNSQIAGYSQGTRNTNDAIGALNTAQAAVETQIDILQRMRELAVQASNGSLTTNDRDGLHAELQQLVTEYTQITSNTQFNGMNLIDGSFGTKTLQVGPGKLQTIPISIDNTTATTEFEQTVGTGAFNARTTVATGTGPMSILTSDLTRNGNKDIVTADGGSGTLSIIMGEGNGSFLGRITASIPTETNGTDIGLADGDFNGDGIKDLVVTDHANGQVSILLGNGDGTFKARTTLAVGAGVNGVAVGDFNRDGKLDIVTADGTDGTISVLMGNGDGTFASRVTYAAGTTPYDIKVADMNGDGIPDIVETDAGGNTVNVLLGNGNGTFQAMTTYAVGTTPHGLALGDINNDGSQDVVVVNRGANTISVLTNNGNGILTTSQTLSASGSNIVTPERVRLADLNGDGSLDMVFTNNGGNSIGIGLGTGSGTFSAPTTISVGTGVYDVALADMNNDGVSDVVTSDYNSLTGADAGIMLSMTRNASAVANLDLRTQAKAQQVVTIVDNAIQTSDQTSSDLASFLSRLDKTVNLNDNLVEQYATARDVTQNVDVALETATLAKEQVLQQAQVACMGQANVQMQSVLALLKFC